MNSSSLVLTDLEKMDRTQLMRAWVAVFDSPAPNHARLGFLTQALAWQQQCVKWEQQSGHKVKNIHKQLRRKLTEASSSSTRKTLSLNVGTQIVREWNGNTYRVTAIDKGYEYAGQTYQSLTAISKLITGTAWSGPKFFGVVK
jgi:hypothetical protein